MTARTYGVRVSTRDLILEAAFDLFAEVGFAGTTISEIERRVGLAAGSGSFYRHFASKEDLLPAAIEREVSKAIADLQAAFPDRSPAREPREDWLRRVLMWLRRTERINRLLLAEGDRLPQLREAVTAAVQAIPDEVTWAKDPVAVVSVAALNGYLLFSRATSSPFYGVAEDELIAVLAALDAASSDAKRTASRLRRKKKRST